MFNLKKKIGPIILFFIIISALIIAFAPPKASADFWESLTKLRQNPATFTPQDVTTSILELIKLLMSFIVGIAVLFLIIGGYQYMTSAGNPEQIQKAKQTIIYAIIGIIVGGAARLITDFTKTQLGGISNINQVVEASINTALLFFSGIAVLMLIIGGYQYMTSAGNPEQIQKAKQTITGAIAGALIVILSHAIATFAFRQAEGKASLTAVLESIINSALGFVFATSILLLLVASYQYITATGNPEQLTKAKKAIFSSLTGLAVSILSYAILRFVTGRLFGITP